MDIKITIEREHLILLVVILAVATIINYSLAQVPAGVQGHDLTEIFTNTTNNLDDNPEDNLIDVEDIKQGPESGLDADTLDGYNSSDLLGGGGQPFLIYDIIGGPDFDSCDETCNNYNKTCAFSWQLSGDYVQLLDNCTVTTADKCACWP